MLQKKIGTNGKSCYIWDSGMNLIKLNAWIMVDKHTWCIWKKTRFGWKNILFSPIWNQWIKLKLFLSLVCTSFDAKITWNFFAYFTKMYELDFVILVTNIWVTKKYFQSDCNWFPCLKNWVQIKNRSIFLSLSFGVLRKWTWAHQELINWKQVAD